MPLSAPRPSEDGTVLVVGASGILAPAAEALRTAGWRVTGVGRTRPMPPGVEWLRTDASSQTVLADAAGGRVWSRALVYAPAVSAASLAWLRAAVSGATTVVETSRAAHPEREDAIPPSDILLLGWAHDGSSRRWHSPEEVSEAALGVFEDGVSAILGSVRPWAERPGGEAP